MLILFDIMVLSFIESIFSFHLFTQFTSQTGSTYPASETHWPTYCLYSLNTYFFCCKNIFKIFTFVIKNANVEPLSWYNLYNKIL